MVDPLRHLIVDPTKRLVVDLTLIESAICALCANSVQQWQIRPSVLLAGVTHRMGLAKGSPARLAVLSGLALMALFGFARAEPNRAWRHRGNRRRYYPGKWPDCSPRRVRCPGGGKSCAM